MRINSNLNSIIVMSVISILLASFKRYLLKHLKYIHNTHRKKLTYTKLLKISKLYRYGILEYLESKMYIENDLDLSLHRSEENKTAKKFLFSQFRREIFIRGNISLFPHPFKISRLIRESSDVDLRGL